MITSKTKVIALIGDPVEHSISPAMHNAAFKEMGLDYVYVSLRVSPEKLKRAVEGMAALNFAGFNVTMPHKQAALNLVDEADDYADSCGAVNTVVVGEKLKGYNTDGPGTIRALKEAKADLSRAVVFGAGGAGSAIAYALAKEGSHVTVLNRSEERAEELAEKIKMHGLNAEGAGLEKTKEKLKDATLLCNATSLGFHSNDTPVGDKLLHEGMTVFDAVYEPRYTRLITEAREKGCNIVPGEKMLLYQGLLGFELWTGTKAPVEVMQKAIEDYLEGK